MKAGQKYLVEVHGWIMCKGIDSGKYRIELSEDYKGSLTATFYKPKGKKPIVRHYLDDIMIDNTRNLNRTEIIKQLT